MACALDVRRRRPLFLQHEAASSSHTSEKVFHAMNSFESDVQWIWNDMKLHHPVLCGQWMSSSLQNKKRVGKEIIGILSDATENADLFRFDFRQRDLSHWSVYLRGPEGTPYDCGWFAAGLDIPNDYPHCPPKFKILTKILHPNVVAESGEVCLDILSRYVKNFPECADFSGTYRFFWNFLASCSEMVTRTKAYKAADQLRLPGFYVQSGKVDVSEALLRRYWSEVNDGSSECIGFPDFVRWYAKNFA
eukprot:s2686_g3.t1